MSTEQFKDEWYEMFLQDLLRAPILDSKSESEDGDEKEERGEQGIIDALLQGTKCRAPSESSSSCKEEISVGRHPRGDKVS